MKLMRAFAASLRNNNMKLLAKLAMLANRREVKIVPRLLQSSRRVPSEVGVEDISGSAMIVVVLVYLNHRVLSWVILENCNIQFH